MYRIDIKLSKCHVDYLSTNKEVAIDSFHGIEIYWNCLLGPGRVSPNRHIIQNL